MHLLLVHHGDAVGPEVDPQRPLSERGRLTVERNGPDTARPTVADEDRPAGRAALHERLHEQHPVFAGPVVVVRHALGREAERLVEGDRPLVGG